MAIIDKEKILAQILDYLSNAKDWKMVRIERRKKEAEDALRKIGKLSND